MRVGIASPRVVVRQVEMPVMTRDELMSALQFQAGDLIPIPIEDAVLDFAILGTSTPTADSGAEPTMQVLLVAAYAATVVRLVSAIEAGGLEVGAVDLIPLALTRALARPVGAMAAGHRWRRRGRRSARRRRHRVLRRRRHRDRRARRRHPAVRACARQRRP